MQYELSGTVYEGVYTSVRFYRNADFQYKIHVPACCETAPECGLIVTHDGLNEADAAAVEFLQKSGKAPACVTVGIVSGNLRATQNTGSARNLRFHTYDLSTGRYADFVVDELLPVLIQKYNLKISASPDLHLVSGGSSGGIAAWNFAWHRNDYFRRVYASSPTFSAMGNGESDPFLIRKFEPKPIRVFTDYSENEPDDYFGSSLIAAQNFEKALLFANYAVKNEYHPNESHCSRNFDYEYAIRRMTYLWQNWQTEPVGVHGFNARVASVIAPDSRWQETGDFDFADHTKITTQQGTYLAQGNRIVLIADGKTTVLTEDFEDISAIALSSDHWRMYIADRKKRCIYAASLAPDGGFDGVYLHASLHAPTEFVHPGVYDLYVDADDRIYAATELGIQCVRSYGLVDVILHHPQKGVTEKTELSADGQLYVRCRPVVLPDTVTNRQEAATCFVRKLNDKLPNATDRITLPRQTSYYD